MEIYVVRHGKTEMNKSGVIIGHLNPPLLPKSIKETKIIAKKLQKIKFTNIYSSNLKRSQETAQALIKQLDYSGKIKISKNLKEINYGLLSGKLKKEMKLKYPKYHNDVKFVNPKGESFNNLYERVIAFIKKIQKEEGPILIITHAGCIRAIYSYYKGTPFQKNINIKIGHDVIMKCNISNGKKKVTMLQI